MGSPMLTAHGVTGSLAWVIVFPLGSILVRLLSGRLAFWAHAFVQSIGLILFTANTGLGIEIALEYMNSFSDYHTGIGIVLFAFAWTQPVSGWIHHILYLKTDGRTITSYIHIWLGRIMITLGIINGGLGLLYAEPGFSTTGERVAYGVVAGVIWFAYLVLCVFTRTRDQMNKMQKFDDGDLKT